MTYDFSLLDSKILAAKEWLTREYQGLRTGRATPSLVEGVYVVAYGTRTPLKQIGSITVEDARTVRIVPWDATLVKEIEKAVTAADLGVGIGADAMGVRISFPELTAERRVEFVKLAKQKLEEARTAVKQARDEIWNDIQQKEKEGELSEDDKFTLRDDLQARVDTGNNTLEAMFGSKEDEITNR